MKVCIYFSVFGILVVAQVQVESAILRQRVQKLLADRQFLARLQESERRNSELLQRIRALENESRQVVKGEATDEQKKALKAAFEENTRRLTAQEWFKKGLALWNGRTYEPSELAVEYFSKTIELDPTNAYALHARGLAYQTLKRFDESIRDLSEFIAREPNNSLAYSNRGNVYAYLGENGKAIRDFDRAIELDNSNAMAFTNRGISHTTLRQYKQALRDFDRAIILDPNNPNQFTNRGIVYNNLGKFKKAISDYDRAISLNPNISISK